MEMLQNSFLQHLHFFFDVLFLQKRRVVSSKTTCCFFENDVLFLRKRRVVSSKMTCCFFENDRSFSMDVWEWKNNIEERENEYREFYL